MIPMFHGQNRGGVGSEDFIFWVRSWPRYVTNILGQSDYIDSFINVTNSLKWYESRPENVALGPYIVENDSDFGNYDSALLSLDESQLGTGNYQIFATKYHPVIEPVTPPIQYHDFTCFVVCEYYPYLASATKAHTLLEWQCNDIDQKGSLSLDRNGVRIQVITSNSISNIGSMTHPSGTDNPSKYIMTFTSRSIWVNLSKELDIYGTYPLTTQSQVAFGQPGDSFVENMMFFRPELPESSFNNYLDFLKFTEIKIIGRRLSNFEITEEVTRLNTDYNIY